MQQETFIFERAIESDTATV